MFGYTDSLCPPVSAQFSCEMESLSCSPAQQWRTVATCTFNTLGEVCSFPSMLGTKFSVEVTGWMDLDSDVAAEYSRQISQERI